MPHAIHDIGVASQIGAYSDAVEARLSLRRLLTSGTPGLSTTGDLPKDISGQAELAWGHVVRMLERAGMSVADLVNDDRTSVNDNLPPNGYRTTVNTRQNGGIVSATSMKIRRLHHE
jgi:enamine deaminase RidA (YjgF/YER057c/UK114 family)